MNYCCSKIKGGVLYTDNNHVGLEGSLYIAKYFDFPNVPLMDK